MCAAERAGFETAGAAGTGTVGEHRRRRLRPRRRAERSVRCGDDAHAHTRTRKHAHAWALAGVMLCVGAAGRIYRRGGRIYRYVADLLSASARAPWPEERLWHALDKVRARTAGARATAHERLRIGAAPRRDARGRAAAVARGCDAQRAPQLLSRLGAHGPARGQVRSRAARRPGFKLLPVAGQVCWSRPG